MRDQVGLFESAGSDQDLSVSVGLLPKASADPGALTAAGRVICKCLLHDQPLGRGLGLFVFEYLADTYEQRVFRNPQLALRALADYDADLARRWMQLLIEPHAGLTLDMFDDSVDSTKAEVEIPATTEELGLAIIAGCRQRLLGAREDSLRALRAGFVEHVDLRVQLGAFSSTELMHMLRGNTHLSVTDLLGCFQWPDSCAPEIVQQAGFAAVGSDVPQYLREIILDESAGGLDAQQRLHLLEWCTALTALPCNGLRELVKLKLYADADPDDLPCVHTCTHEIFLPAYVSRQQLQSKLLVAVAHRHDGFRMD